YQPRKKPTPKVDPELVRELARIGNNLNQLTKTANQMRAQGEHLDALRLLSALHDMEDELEQIRDHHTIGQAVAEVSDVG
ncbi:MobC family plasmid mobilization relaxosome protein, partial [Litorimonas sp.]|uniref:MobC family plasmid mobilization relaxosome protein n=1 Tax=Litorimonas sp. TaxID=1892381 RepID=UPI003A84C86A